MTPAYARTIRWGVFLRAHKGRTKPGNWLGDTFTADEVATIVRYGVRRLIHELDCTLEQLKIAVPELESFT